MDKNKLEGMNKEQILKAIKSLSKSQGFYCGVLREVKERPSILKELEKQSFKDAVDMVLFFEC